MAELGSVFDQPWLRGYIEHALYECARDERMVAAFNERYGTALQAPILQIIEPGRDENLNKVNPHDLAAITRFSDDVITGVSNRLQQLMTKQPWVQLIEELNRPLDAPESEPAHDEVDAAVAEDGTSFPISRQVALALGRIERRPMTLNDVLPLTYEWLRHLSHSMCRREGAIRTLQPTALLHEVYLKLSGTNPEIRDSAHLCGLIAQNIRWMLTDCGKARHREKRQLPSCEELLLLVDAEYPGWESIDASDVDVAFTVLEKTAPRASTIAVYHYYLGLGNPEIEAILNVSPITVSRELRFAKAWLRAFVCRQQQQSPVLATPADKADDSPADKRDAVSICVMVESSGCQSTVMQGRPKKTVLHKQQVGVLDL